MGGTTRAEPSCMIEPTSSKPNNTNGAHTDVDVLVVGQGITALSIAYELSVRGKRVAIVGDHTSPDVPDEAWLTSAFDGCFTRLELQHGAEGARLAVESHGWAIDRIEHIATSDSIDCGFTRLDRCFDETSCTGSGTLAHELAAAYRAGLRDAQLMRTDSGRALLRIPRQAFFHPVRYAEALTRTLEYMGVDLRLSVGVDRVDGAVTELSPGMTRQMIIAFAGDREILRAPVAIVTSDGFVRLPEASSRDVVGRIGLVSGVPGIYVARAGLSNGCTDGVIAGALIAELLEGRSHRWEKLYDPMRRAPAAIPPFELGVPDIAAPIGPPGELGSTSAIEPGQGGVVRLGGVPLAVYRNEQGALHERSAICTHLGGIVSWNAADKTFDCHCHGSRFDAFGRVQCGPASEDLPVLPASDLEAPPESHTRTTLTSVSDEDAGPWDVAAQHLR